MDAGEIVWLVVIALWALFSRVGRKRRQAASGSPVSNSPTARPPIGQTLRDLLRQLQEGPAIPEAAAPVEEQRSVKPREREVEIEEDSIPVPVRPETVPWGREGHRTRRSALVQGLLDDLGSDSASLARAMLLREVLGRPVALRKGWGRPEV